LLTLGIDPGTARLGFGLVDDAGELRCVEFGVVETSSRQAMPLRLVELHDAIESLIARHRPDALAVEQLFFARNVTNALAVGQARGVVLLAAARAGLDVAEYTPSEVKQAVSGYGKADKAQMGEMVRIILGLDRVPRPDDAADALAVALCHAQTTPFKLRVGASRWT